MMENLTDALNHLEAVIDSAVRYMGILDEEGVNPLPSATTLNDRVDCHLLHINNMTGQMEDLVKSLAILRDKLDIPGPKEACSAPRRI